MIISHTITDTGVLNEQVSKERFTYQESQGSKDHHPQKVCCPPFERPFLEQNSIPCSAESIQRGCYQKQSFSSAYNIWKKEYSHHQKTYPEIDREATKEKQVRYQPPNLQTSKPDQLGMLQILMWKRKKENLFFLFTWKCLKTSSGIKAMWIGATKPSWDRVVARRHKVP